MGEPQTMVERVAKAIATRLGVDREHWADYQREAYAAIAAMREPSRSMVDSGVAFALIVTLGGDYRWSDYVADKHRAMIDAALAEQPKTERISHG